ncbi:hypothetical protein A7U60_g6953 [Sanghuangporus baumii]|uniref:Uncharacterized protein n=1 Tax=Sanghuangporus baumii TaxID=108892 RepID=A0A9Q5N137_SANBA|nr:hypothetical protein A7U60_g6953 [Sanghuangporus baumii]
MSDKQPARTDGTPKKRKYEGEQGPDSESEHGDDPGYCKHTDGDLEVEKKLFGVKKSRSQDRKQEAPRGDHSERKPTIKFAK